VRNDRSLAPEGYPEFAVTPPGVRDDYFVIDYIEPMAGNEAAFGFDHGHEAVRRAQINRAIETGAAIASGRVKLVQPYLTGAGFSMRMAVYAKKAPLQTADERRRATIGLVGAAFSTDNLLRGVVGNKIGNSLQVMIYDSGPTDALPFARRADDRLMFDSAAILQNETVAAPWFDRLVLGDAVNRERVTSINVGERTWDLYFSSPRRVLSTEYLQWPLMAFFAGLVISFLVWSLIRSLETSRRRAYAMAGEITRELRANEAETRKLSLVASRTHSAVVITDAHKRIEWVNDGFTRITGYTLDDVRGRMPGAFLQGPDTDAETVAKMRANLARSESCRVEILNYGKTGRPYWLDVEIQPIYSAAGELTNFMAIETEITERKRIEHAIREQEAQMRLITDNVPVSIAYYDAERICCFANKAYAQLFGLGVDEIVGKPLKSIAKSANFDEMNAQVGAALGGRLAHYLHCFELPDMRVAYMEVTLVPHVAEGGTVVGFYVMRVDITERYIAETELRATQERLDLALDGSELALWDWEIATGRVYVSERWFEMLGGPKESGVIEFGELEKVVHPDDLERVRHRIASVLKGKSAIYYAEHRVLARNGEWRWIESHGKVTERDAAGRAVRMTGTNADITARKEADEALRSSQKFLADLVNAVADPVFVKDEEHRLTMVNDAYCAFIGRRREDLVGLTATDIFPPDKAARMLTDDKAVLASLGESHSIVESAGNDGHTRVHSTRKRAFVSATGGKMLVGIIRDVTELKQAQEAAEAANRAKSNFLANMSHEIRTPMNGIIGMTDLALETSLSEEQRELIGTVKSCADSLLDIINEILDFSKIEAGAMTVDVSEFSLRRMLADMLKVLALRAHQKGLEIVCSVAPAVPARLRGDAVKLRQVLINLIGNAIKFTERGEIELKVDAVARTGDEVRLAFSVRDTGIGIPTDKQQLVFEAFSQADGSTTRQYGGTGLGLTISARLAQLIGGKLEVESAPGHGSRFYFDVPFECADGAAIAPALPHLLGMRVLIADDNRASRDALSDIMQAAGMRPHAVAGGQAALAALREAARDGTPYALLVIDAGMPDCDGFAVAAALRAEPQRVGGVIMLLSADGRMDSPARCRELGVEAYLVKPVLRPDLLDAIAKMAKHVDAGRAPAAVPQPAPTCRDAILRVLVAEDNPVNQRLICHLLGRRGYRVHAVDNGQAAVAAFAAEPFDVVLMDVQMPVMGGLEAAQLIRDHEKTRGGHTPMLALTAHAMSEDRARCLAAGMDDYLTKPLKAAELFAVIERVTGAATAANAPPAGPGGDASAGECTVDLAALRAEIGDSEIVANLCSLFMQDAPQLVADLERALRAGDMDLLYRTAHRLKGSVGIFHAPQAVARLDELEAAARAGDGLRARVEFTASRAVLDSLFAQLRGVQGRVAA